MIPKVVHRIWLGSPLPPAAIELGEQWARHFPDYRMELWDDDRLVRLGMPARWFAARTYAERADVARYLVLIRFGGVYADCDVEPLTRFDSLWSDADTFVGFHESPDLVWNGLIVAGPGHRVLRIANALAARSARRQAPDAAPNVRTGPFVFTAALDYARTVDPTGLRLYPAHYAHFQGDRSSEAVVSSPFRDPPTWVEVGPEPPRRARLGTRIADATANARTMASLAPVRLRRRRRSTGARSTPSGPE